MQCIENALLEVYAQIPPQVLQLAFIDKHRKMRGVPLSLDAIITDTIINKRVSKDVNFVGGQEVVIPLFQLKPERPDPYSYLYRIPKDLTNGRSITSCLSVIYYMANNWAMYSNGTSVSGNNYNVKNQGAGVLHQQAKALIDVNGPIPVISTANTIVLGENVILINDYSGLVVTGGARCLVGYDPQFSTIVDGAKNRFAELVVLATKAWIYNNVIVPIDVNELVAGSELGVVKTIIERYEDAEEKYQELRKTWRKVATLSDPVRKQRYIRRLIGFAR